MLQTLYNWTKSNSMQWNEVKFNLLRLAPNRVIKNNALFFTPEYENIISKTNRIKVLGIFLIINYHSNFKGKMQDTKKILMGSLNLYE